MEILKKAEKEKQAEIRKQKIMDTEAQAFNIFEYEKRIEDLKALCQEYGVDFQALDQDYVRENLSQQDLI